MVEIESQSYQIARQYMIRLTESDLNNSDLVGRYAALSGLSAEAFKERFSGAH
jgi:6-phosphofructokinase 1